MARPIIDNIDKEIGYFSRGNTFGLIFWRPGATKATRVSLGKKVDKKEAIQLRDQLREIRDCYKAHPKFNDPVYKTYDNKLIEMYFKLGSTGTSLVGKSEPIDPKTFWMKMGEKNEQIKKLKEKLVEKDQIITDLQLEIELYKDNIHAKHATIAKDIEDNDQVLLKYEEWFLKKKPANERQKKNFQSTVNNYLNIIKYVFKMNPGKKINDFTSDDLEDWLDHFVEFGYPDRNGKLIIQNRSDPHNTFNRTHQKLTQFFNWSSKKWKFQNPTDYIEKRKENQNKSIQYHSLEEIDKLMTNIGKRTDINSIYFQALIGSIAFAGLCPHELRALKTKDVDTENLKIWISRDIDIDVSLKDPKRNDNININDDLLPLLKVYINTGIPSKYFFPHHNYIKTDKRPWKDSNQLSNFIHGKGTSNSQILPEKIGNVNCDCRSLRRTFGSLLLRNGNSITQVAAALRNTERTCKRWYARYNSGDIDTNIRPQRRFDYKAD